MVQTAVEAALLVTLLDRAGLMPGVAWLEMHLDHWSIQATLLHGQRGRVRRAAAPPDAGAHQPHRERVGVVGRPPAVAQPLALMLHDHLAY